MPFSKLMFWLQNMFSKGNKPFALGLYGTVNTGKSTLANRICMDWCGEKISESSEVPHETRTVKKREKIEMNIKGRKLTINLLDMPGITTKVDYREFMEFGFKKDQAQQRAKEATKGIIEAIKWLDNVDVALVVMDACEDPYTQVNLTILGNLEARKIPFIVVANKIDKKSSKPDKLREAFPQHDVVEISALDGTNVNKLYESIARKI